MQERLNQYRPILAVLIAAGALFLIAPVWQPSPPATI